MKSRDPKPGRRAFVRSGFDAGCPLCAMSGEELADFWDVLLQDGEAFARDGEGYRRYTLEELGSELGEHDETARPRRLN